MTRPSGVCSVRTLAPKPRSIRSVWSRVGSFSITTVSPGAFSPASSTADFTCAEGTGVVYCTGIGFAAPVSVIGSRPPRRPRASAPKSARGSVIRPIGRPRRLASPVKVAVMSVVAIAPMTRRTPVPELPWSITSSGSWKPPTPTPSTRQAPGAGALDRGAEGAHGAAGVEHVLALEEAADPGLADRERAEDQRAVRDRLVARAPPPGRGSGPEASACIGFGSPWPATFASRSRFPPHTGSGDHRSIGEREGGRMRVNGVCDATLCTTHAHAYASRAAADAQTRRKVRYCGRRPAASALAS